MPCYSPLHAYKAKSPDPQKTVITFARRESWKAEKLELPCGQCIGCRLERSRQWAVRCMHEASLYQDNSFLTLTFDDKYLPKGSGSCARCTRPHLVEGSLCVSVLQDFFKRLRRSVEYDDAEGNRVRPQIRYYACGEYGETYGRPHFHALLFNHGFNDKKIHSQRNGMSVYTSAQLSEVWPFGFSVIGEVTFESAAYVARYVMKKITGEKAEAHYAGKLPEFTVMSRRPGIGTRWLEKFQTDVYPRDRVIVRGVPTRPPRFYDNLLTRKDPSRMALLKLKRSAVAEHFVEDYLDNGKKILVSDQDGRRLLVKEEVKLAQIKSLIRPLEV